MNSEICWVGLPVKGKCANIYNVILHEYSRAIKLETTHEKSTSPDYSFTVNITRWVLSHGEYVSSVVAVSAQLKKGRVDLVQYYGACFSSIYKRYLHDLPHIIITHVTALSTCLSTDEPSRYTES